MHLKCILQAKIQEFINSEYSTLFSVFWSCAVCFTGTQLHESKKINTMFMSSKNVPKTNIKFRSITTYSITTIKFSHTLYLIIKYSKMVLLQLNKMIIKPPWHPHQLQFCSLVTVTVQVFAGTYESIVCIHLASWLLVYKQRSSVVRNPVL